MLTPTTTVITVPQELPLQFTVSEADFLNPKEWDFENENQFPWLFHDHGFTIGVVFAESGEDAWEAIAETGKLDNFIVEENDPDYSVDDHSNGRIKLYANRFMDVDLVSHAILPRIPMSFWKLYKASKSQSDKYPDLAFADSDVIEVDDWLSYLDCTSPHLPHIVCSPCGVLGVSFATNAQDALDLLADADKLKYCHVPEKDLINEDENYPFSRIGNDCAAYDLSDIQILQVPSPALSFLTLLQEV